MGDGPQHKLSLIPEGAERAQVIGDGARSTKRSRILVPLGWLTIYHVSFLHVPLGSSILQTGSSWFRAHNCHLHNREVVSQIVTSLQSLLIPSLDHRLPFYLDSRLPGTPSSLPPLPLTCSHCP